MTFLISCDLENYLFEVSYKKESEKTVKFKAASMASALFLSMVKISEGM